MNIQTINPATEVVLETYPSLNEIELNEMIKSGHTAFLSWRKTTFAERRKLLLQVAALLKQKADSLSRLIAQEMGKPITQGRQEIEKCAWVCEHFAEQAESYLQSRTVKTEMSKSFVCYQPLGVVLGIMPWNFPFWQVFRFAAPTLMAGNTSLLKHAPISIGAGKAIAALFEEAGFPKEVFQHAILNDDMAARAIAHRNIVALSFTGSEKTGKIVGSLAASGLKKCVLELGGSDPYIVLADADLELAAKCIVTSRLNNCGQVCIAAKRIIAIESIHDELVKKIATLMKGYQMGDPLQPATNLGPMARGDLREFLDQQVVESIAKGAKLLLGGKLPEGKGFYYPPTLLTNVNEGMPAFDEELFGPVIAVIKCSNDKEAIELANRSSYGLGAAIFTQNLAYGEEIASQQLEVGACFVNAYVASDPRLPFGGIKHSGFGRELSREGILEFVNTKTVAVK